MSGKETLTHKIAESLSEDGIEKAIETNERLGPYRSEHFTNVTIMLPDDPETLGALAATIMAQHCRGAYVGELIVDDRIVHSMESQGFVLTIIEDDVISPKIHDLDLKPTYESIEDEMDSGNGVIFDPSHKHRNGKDLL